MQHASETEPAVRICVSTLGCAKNRVDTERMLASLQQLNPQFTDDPASADVLFVNTCGFIDAARDESIGEIIDLAAYKHSGTARALVVAGCLVSLYRHELGEELPEVDLFISTDPEQMQRLPALLLKLLDRQPIRPASPLQRRLLSTGPGMAYLKIAEGCDNSCTYCTIPQIRGPQVSSPISQLLDEARELRQQGVRELVLIAQDSMEYGRDLDGTRQTRTLIEQLGELEFDWLRLLYTYPNDFDPALLELAQPGGPLLPYFDIPLQHISDPVLRRMGRNIDSARIRQLMQRIRTRLPQAYIRTSLITGFPGETREDFRLLRDFVAEGAIDHLGVFAYSDEELAASSRLPDKVDPALAAERRDELMEIQQSHCLERMQALQGSCIQVLVEGPCDESDLLLQGRAWFQAPEVDGRVLINEGQYCAGDLAELLVHETHAYDLIAGPPQ